MIRVKSAATEGARGGVMVTGYGAIGVLAEGVVAHKWPWLGYPGMVTMAVTAGIHALVEAYRDWVA